MHSLNIMPYFLTTWVIFMTLIFPSIEYLQNKSVEANQIVLRVAGEADDSS